MRGRIDAIRDSGTEHEPLVAGLRCLLQLPLVDRNANKLSTWLMRSRMPVGQRDGHDTLLLDGEVVLCEEVAEYAVARAAMHEYAAGPTTARGRGVDRDKVISCLKGVGIAAGGSKHFARLTDGRVRAILTRRVPSAGGAEVAHESSWSLMSGIAAASQAALQRDVALRPHLVAFELLAARAGLLPLYPSSVDIAAFTTPRASAADPGHRSLVLSHESAPQMLPALTTSLAGKGGGREYFKDAARFRPHDGVVVVNYRCIYGGAPAAAAPAAAVPATAVPVAAAPATAAPAPRRGQHHALHARVGAPHGPARGCGARWRQQHARPARAPHEQARWQPRPDAFQHHRPSRRVHHPARAFDLAPQHPRHPAREGVHRVGH